MQQQLADLAKEYELIRELMPSGDARTVRMENVVTRMRTIAPDVRPLLNRLEASQSAGERLAAVAILEIFPDCAHLPWLVQRFQGERKSLEPTEKPFIAYHAAEALREAVRRLRPDCRSALRRAVRKALKMLQPAGAGTEREYVLQNALKDLDENPL